MLTHTRTRTITRAGGPPARGRPPEERTHLLGQVLVQLVVTLVNVSGYGGQR